MKAEVIVSFYDLETGLGSVPENTYQVGSVFEGTPERVQGLVDKGFVKKMPARRRQVKPKEK